MKNVRYFNFRDICDRNLWDTGYSVKKLIRDIKTPLMGPQSSSTNFESKNHKSYSLYMYTPPKQGNVYTLQGQKN